VGGMGEVYRATDTNLRRAVGMTRVSWIISLWNATGASSSMSNWKMPHADI
jgi:hypothetical protein